MKTKSIIFYIIGIFFTSNNYAQLQSENILYSLNEKENFIIDDYYYLYTDKGKFSIEDEVSKQNWNNYFLKYKNNIIGRYTFEDELNINKLTCQLYITNKKISSVLGIKKTITLMNLKKNEFEKGIINSFKDLPLDLINSAEIINNKGYFLYKYKFYNASLIYFNKTLEISPTRTVAYLNIADCHWELKNNDKAIENYNIYIQLMKEQKKDLKKIPKYVYDRLKKS